MYKPLTLHLRGLSGLVMHNGQLADPLSPFARAIKTVSARRTKTEADHEELAKLEFLGSLYVTDNMPCLPGEMIEACLMHGARRSKQGKQAAAGLLSDGNHVLQYPGPITPDELWADERFRLRAAVRVGTGRVMRTRPIFRDWSAVVVVEFNDALVNASDVLKWAEVAGAEIGLGDWRPRFGRFAVQAM